MPGYSVTPNQVSHGDGHLAKIKWTVKTWAESEQDAPFLSDLSYQIDQLNENWQLVLGVQGPA